MATTVVMMLLPDAKRSTVASAMRYENSLKCFIVLKVELRDGMRPSRFGKGEPESFNTGSFVRERALGKGFTSLKKTD